MVTIVVLGGTGKQGTAVVKHLLHKGRFTVVAVVRDPNSPKAQKLVSEGVRIVQGDMSDRASLEQAFRGAAGVFSVQVAIDANGKGMIDEEISQGKNVADACKSAGVRHLVYSSVASANKNTGVPHFDSKWQIENHIRGLGIPFTILRPVAFMDNMAFGEGAEPKPGVAKFLTAPDTKVQYVACDDIGGVAAMCFADPATWIGKEVDLAGDELSGHQLAKAYERVCGYPFTYDHPPHFILKLFAPELHEMIEWLERVGYSVNIPEMRRAYPMKTVEQWLADYGMASKLRKPEPCCVIS